MNITTKDGRVIPLRPVGKRYVEQVMAKHPIPDPPTYTITTVAGDVETHRHNVSYDKDGKVLKSSMSTPEEWDAWHAYEAARSKAVTDRYQAATEFLICQCVALDPPPLSEWGMDFETWGIAPPDTTDPKALKVFWVENELAPDPDDQSALLGELYRIGGIVAADRVKEFESFFRLTLARLTSG